MKDIDKLYQEKRMSVEEALDLIQDRDYIFSAQAAAEAGAILSKIHLLKTRGVRDCILHSCLPMGDFEFFRDPDLRGVLDHNTWFLSASLRRAFDQKLVNPIPQSTTSVLKKTMDRVIYERRRPVLLASVSPMDKHGYLSLSISTIYEMDILKYDPLIILEVNPNYPRTFGDVQIHISQVHGLVESDLPIPTVSMPPYTETDAKIARHIAELVEDGSTIQLGIGNIPNAVANELKSKRGLGIHTEMFTENMVDLIECGAVDNRNKGLYDGYSLCTFALGSQRVYDFLDDNPSVLFKSCSYVNDWHVIGMNNKFVSINGGLEVDLMGQVASETLGSKPWSGTGGQSDTVRGAQLSKGGKSIIALHSSFSSKDQGGREVLKSKIVPYFQKNTTVTVSRNDVDYVVTEYGVAWLRGLNLRRRVEELVKIAHPDFRDQLMKEARDLSLYWD